MHPDTKTNNRADLNTALNQTHLAGNSVIAWQHYRLQAVACDTPLLIIPFTGRKSFKVGTKLWECHAGQFLITHFAVQADVENIPDDHAPYRAWVIPFSWETVAMARALLAGQKAIRASDSTDLVGVGELPLIAESLQAYLSDADTDDPVLSNYRLLGILVALFRAGHSQFMLASDPRLSSRIRVAVSADPARIWTSAHFEEAFFLSGATLRRRLVAEGASLRALIQEARLHSALMHLQTSSHSLKTVAFAHGYRSVTAFSRNFSKRFGIDPVEVIRRQT